MIGIGFEPCILTKTAGLAEYCVRPEVTRSAAVNLVWDTICCDADRSDPI